MPYILLDGEDLTTEQIWATLFAVAASCILYNPVYQLSSS